MGTKALLLRSAEVKALLPLLVSSSESNGNVKGINAPKIRHTIYASSNTVSDNSLFGQGTDANRTGLAYLARHRWHTAMVLDVGALLQTLAGLPF